MGRDGRYDRSEGIDKLAQNRLGSFGQARRHKYNEPKPHDGKESDMILQFSWLRVPCTKNRLGESMLNQ